MWRGRGAAAGIWVHPFLCVVEALTSAVSSELTVRWLPTSVLVPGGGLSSISHDRQWQSQHHGHVQVYQPGLAPLLC